MRRFKQFFDICSSSQPFDIILILPLLNLFTTNGIFIIIYQ
ncbi:hypothetical protein AZZ82_000486, partial [Klebsiella aerogenes]